jgi:hypothetical protein
MSEARLADKGHDILAVSHKNKIMRAKKLLISALLLLAPTIGFSQGKGNGNGKGNSNKNGHNKAAKVKVKEKDNKVDAWQGKTRNDNVIRVDNDNRPKSKSTRVKGGPPAWAPAHGYRAKNHAYFPDYHTFYDANRGGYVYWNSGRWIFTPNTPSFLSGVNLRTARLQLLNDIPVTTHPEVYYSRYSTAYPARPVTISVPVPVIVR